MYYCYNEFDEITTPAEIRHAQVIYLWEVAHSTMEEISKYTHYALSTVNIYINKFKHLLDYAKSIFTKEKPIKDRVAFDCEYEETGAYTYIIECYNKNYDLEYLKVGMTNNLQRRFSEIGRNSYAKYIKVKKVYSFSEIDAAGAMECILRLV